MSKLIIGADIVPTTSNQDIFENAQMEHIIDKDLLEVLRDVDYRIFNLEVPLTDTEAPIKKCGPNLIASTKSVTGLKQLGIDFLTLANNHILDQSEQGLWSTTEQLDKIGIAYAGIGRTPAEAAEPYIVELDDKKVGIYCCAEHEFSIVSDRQAGANSFDPLESLDHIVGLKAKCDYVICLYHGGKEHYRYPSPNLQKTCRKIVEKGADLVICQHTHCVGCEEKWNDGTIVYGQGNFLFDHSDREYWQTSVLVSIDLDAYSVMYFPILKDGKGVRLADQQVADSILEQMRERSLKIQEKGFVEENYSAFAREMLSSYITSMDSWASSFVFRALNKALRNNLSKRFISRMINKRGLWMINTYECEAHRELLLRGLYDL